MTATLLLTTLLIAAPQATVSYKKRVMTDPGYKPAMTKEQITAALQPAPRPRRVRATPPIVHVHRPRYRETYEASWVVPAVAVGLAAYAWGHSSHYRHGRHGRHYRHYRHHWRPYAHFGLYYGW